MINDDQKPSTNNKNNQQLSETISDQQWQITINPSKTISERRGDNQQSSATISDQQQLSATNKDDQLRPATIKGFQQPLFKSDYQRL